VRPEVVVQVSFIEWTGHGKLRHSRLIAVRRDKRPREVVKQPAAPTSAGGRAAKEQS
jgi:bifunctional non-homologous end joining protein LigD